MATTIAADGHAAVELAVQARPHVILVDVDTSLLDGLFVTSRLRRSEGRNLKHGNNLPVVAYTARPHNRWEALLQYSGIDYIIKNVGFDFHILEYILRRYSAAPWRRQA